MSFDNNRKRDEFYWEREFRKDDMRIRSCMHELPAVIDLPEEEELLRHRLQKQPGYVLNRTNFDNFSSDEFIDFDDIMFPDNWREREGAAIYGTTEQLMKEWGTIYAAKLEDTHNNSGIKILCLYGKIMGFSIDLVDAGEEKMPELKIALCKRILSGINQIVSLIDQIGDDAEYMTSHKTALNILRHKVLHLRFKLKNELGNN